MNTGTKQTARILQYMETHGSITALQAMRDLGIYRLAARIHDLKKLHWVIERDYITVSNRYGGVTQIARYQFGTRSDVVDNDYKQFDPEDFKE
tara:strand:- start:914 stop:1192 length:279 start_codon:yes stop_codon:yes gene_type:complete